MPFRLVSIILTIVLCAGGIFSQKREILLDPDGKPISNNEFRDYSLSDPKRKDPFTRTVRPDGVVELRLNRNKVEGTTMPSFTAQTIDGKTLNFEDKVVVLNFWFIGCPGCMEEIPKLNELATKYADRSDIVFLAVTPDEVPAMRRFFQSVPFSYQQMGGGEKVLDMFGSTSFPRNVVVGRLGTIVYWRSSIKAWDKFESVINTQLDTPRMSPNLN